MAPKKESKTPYSQLPQEDKDKINARKRTLYKEKRKRDIELTTVQVHQDEEPMKLIKANANGVGHTTETIIEDPCNVQPETSTRGGFYT